MIGRTIGHYRIESKLGEGGMGIVYKARDAHLDRFVALKMLPLERTADPERKRRFVQEAKAASALNHANILHIYDLEAVDDVDFIAMEYFEGQTLADVIGRKGLPVRDTLKYAIQVADGLAAAHAAGIVHRDIKPGNIMVNEKGVVKILDFGLAKLTDPTEGGGFATTKTMRPQTEEGMIMGTVAYMSPEQAEGKKVDSRSDVFSFGSVLYEMATGARAFQGQTKVSTLSAILHQEPKPPGEITPALPRELERIISQCLRKGPSRRFQHMDDVRVLLEELKEESEAGRLAAAEVGRVIPAARRWRLVPVSAAAILAVAAALLWLSRNENGGSEPSEAPMMRLTSDTGLTVDPALSPDGKFVAYASDRAGADNLDIWVQQIDGGAPLRLTSDLTNERGPSFSPEGSRIVFRSERDGGGIYTIPALGGEPRLIAKRGRHARFSPDGARIAFVTGVGGPGGVLGAELFIIDSVGGTPQKLVPGDIGATNPVWSPDGKWILFAIGQYRIDNWAIVPANLAEPITRQQLGATFGASQPGPISILKLDQLKKSGLGELTPNQWLPGNRVIFSAKSGDTSHVFNIGLSPPSMRAKQWGLSSSPRRLTFGSGFDEAASLSTPGPGSGVRRRLAFASLGRKENLWSLALDAAHPHLETKLHQLTQENGFHVFPWVSADGTRITYISHAAYNDEVWLLNLKGGKRSLLSTTVSPKYTAYISPDGSQVVYGDRVNGAAGVYAVSATGGAPTRLCGKCNWYINDWSPDHRRLLVWARGKSGVGVAMYNLETGNSGLYLEHKSADLYWFRWSPDGRWLTFVATEGARSRVYAAPFTGDEGPAENSWIPITDGSTWEDKAVWSPDGNWIYTVSDRDGFPCIWAYRVNPQTKMPAGVPMVVFHSHGARLSLRNVNVDSQVISVAHDKIVFNMGEITGNIWMTELEQNGQ